MKTALIALALLSGTSVAVPALAADSLGSLSTRGIVRPAFLKELLDERLPSHPGYYGEMIWILMMLEQWLQAHHPRWGRL